MIEKKVVNEFCFEENSLSNFLKKTTLNDNWLENQNLNIKFDCFKGEDSDLDKSLLELKNPDLVFSLMLHLLGRGLFCSKTVHRRFKHILKENLFKTSDNTIPESEFSKKIYRLKSMDKIEDLIEPYDQLSKELDDWNNESITWDQYVYEIKIRELFYKQLKDSCNEHFLLDSDDFLENYLACLHFDTYCWKNLKKAIDYDKFFFKDSRIITYHFPNKKFVKCLQTRELQQHRDDKIIPVSNKKEKNEMRLNYQRIKSGYIDLHILNEISKNNLEDQEKLEFFHSMFGIEVQKNPATLIYNMMMSELIHAKQITKRDLFDNGNIPGIMPYGLDGNTTASRYLNIYYSHIFDHWYSYDILNDNKEKLFEIIMNPESVFNNKRGYTIKVEEMIKREHDLFHKWISYRAQYDEKAQLLRTIRDLWTYVLAVTKEKFKSFGLNIDD